MFPSLPRYVSALFIGRHGIDKAMQDISGEMTPWLGIRGPRRLDRSLLLRPAGTRTFGSTLGTYGGSRVHIVSFARSKKLVMPLIPFPEIGPEVFFCPLWAEGVI